MLRDFFRPPEFADPKKTQRAATLFTLIWINSLVGILALLGIMLTQPEIVHAATTNLFILAFMAFALLAIGKRGWIDSAAWLLIGIDIASTSLRALTAGGIRAPGVTLFFVYPLMAGLLLGERAGIATAIVCAAIGLGLVLGEHHNLLPDQTVVYNNFTAWWIGCFYMCLVIYLLRLATRNTNNALMRAEAELEDRRKTEQHLSIALNAAAIGIWDGDLRATRFRADERTAAVLCLPRAADGTIAFEAWRAMVHPEDLPAVTWGIQQMIEGAVPQGKGEFRLLLANGEIRHIEASSAVVRDKDGTVVSFVGTVIDITQQKRAEIERKLGEVQRRSLETQLLQAQKKEALGTLASGIAHDFNNLLGAILGFSGFLRDDAVPGSQSRFFAERIAAACGRGKDIVTQIVTFARTGAQPQTAIELCDLLRECRDLLAAPAGVTVNFSSPPREIHVRGNAGQILRLVTNLCMNAAESFEGRPGRIVVQLDLPGQSESEAAAAPHRHSIGRIEAGQAYARIKVSDNGGGIAPAILERIFDPFFTTKGRQRGTGLGLSVVQGIVESHDGFCLVESEPAKGTSFAVFFPLLEQAAPKPQKAPAVFAALKGTERILVLDDEVDITDWLRIGLGRLGYQVAVFNDPLQAVAAFRETPDAWDIVIADQIMPNMRGSEFLEIVKALNPKALTVLCSGHGEEDPAQEQAELCLPKPITLAELTGSLRGKLSAR